MEIRYRLAPTVNRDEELQTIVCKDEKDFGGRTVSQDTSKAILSWVRGRK